MKFSQLLVTAVLVAAGIVVYDQVVRPGADLTVEDTISPIREAAETPAAPDVLAPIRLEGTGDDLALEELDRRLTLLEQAVGGDDRLTALLDPGMSPGARAGAADPAPGKTAPTPAPDSSEADGEEAGRDPRISDAQAFLNPLPASVEELRDFRKRMEWVERQRRIEKEGKGISDWLTRQGVSLTPAQRLDVVRAALVYKQRARQLPKAPPDDEAAQEAQQANYQNLRDDFVNDLYVMVPAAEADRIVEGMQLAADAAEKARAEKEARQGK